MGVKMDLDPQNLITGLGEGLPSAQAGRLSSQFLQAYVIEDIPNPKMVLKTHFIKHKVFNEKSGPRLAHTHPVLASVGTCCVQRNLI